MKSSTKRRVFAPVGVVGVLALTLLGVMGSVQAAPAPNLPDGSKTGTLHITKYDASNPTNTVASGEQQSPAGQTPLKDVTFVVKKVNGVDLTTNDGWRAASDLQASVTAAVNAAGSNAAAITAAEAAVGGVGSAIPGTPTKTGADGVMTFSGLSLGLYLVEETGTPAGATPSYPFLVTLPMTNPATPTSDDMLKDPNDLTTWNYDVWVYPKNAVATVTKTVKDDAGSGTGNSILPGDNVTWILTGDIPDSDGATANKVTGYKMSDTLNAALTYTGETVYLGVPGATGTVKLVEGTDYNVTKPAGTTGGDWAITFTQTGLDKLSANRDKQVVVQLTAKVNTAIGDITNTARLFPNKDAIDTNAYVESTTDTKWGSVTFQKIGMDTNQPLTGAVFRIYTSKADANAGTNPVSFNGTTDLTVDSNGKVSIPAPGLRYSDYADGKQLTSDADPAWQYYWIAEVQAPSGYSLLAEPIQFTVSGNATTIAAAQKNAEAHVINAVDDAVDSAAVDAQIADAPHNAGFPLPFTGGPGVTAAYLAGLLVVAGAVTLGFAARRRRDNDAQDVHTA